MKPPTDRSRLLLALAALILAVHAATSVVLGGSPLGSLASNLLQVAASATAALACTSASRRAGGFERRFWVLVAAAFWIWSAAQASYAYLENWEGTGVGQPSWTHLLFRLYGAPLLMALLIGREEEMLEGPDWQRVLDFAQVGILFLFFYFDLYFVPGGAWQGLTGLDLWGFIDLSDLENWLLFAAFLARALWLRHPEERRSPLRLSLYLFAYALGSSFYNYEYSFEAPRTGEWPDLVFTASLTLGSFLAGAFRPEALPEAPAREPAPVVNWVPAVLPLITLALALPMARHEPEVAFIAVFASVACFGARLIITLHRGRRLMEALRASESRYASLLRLAPDAIYVHAGGRITFANPATARLLGLASAEELVGRDMLDFAPPGERAALTDQVSRLTNEPVSGRLTVVRPDGVQVSLDTVAMALEPASAGSGPPARLVIARDVTDRDRAEAERETLVRELEAKNSELERFTYTVSHDLRSPLITVTGYLSHVEEAAARGDLAGVRSDLDRVRRAAKKMDKLLRDLLDLSRIGHVLSTPESVPFERLAQDALDLVGGRLRERGVSVEIEPGLPVVWGDRGRLLEVLQNLLDNSAKFMSDQPAPRIRIGARDDGGETVLFVEDNGPGIDPAHHERIFGLFDKLDPKAEGTGVGLALVKRIVELHGGRIWVESLGGGGATFCFTLPDAPDPLP